MYVGGVQFVYACLTGGYPFNSFLAGFSAAVGQFVLAGMTCCSSCANWEASLRSQVDKANRTEFPEISPERYLLRFDWC
jgi:dolichyl-diphosphooligosaccharide---protein glycosyltransferase subunit DAD1/OST2